MLEKPYRGLAWHAPGGKARAGARSRAHDPLAYQEEADAAAPEEEPERAYPDGSIPSECWNASRAFAREAPKKEGGGEPWSGI